MTSIRIERIDGQRLGHFLFLKSAFGLVLFFFEIHNAGASMDLVFCNLRS